MGAEPRLAADTGPGSADSASASRSVPTAREGARIWKGTHAPSYPPSTEIADEGDRLAPGTPPSASLIVACVALWGAALGIFVWRAVLRPPSRSFLVGSLASFALAALAVTLVTRERHDYVHFVEQWRNTMTGGDPWDQSLDGENPGYGPLFNAIAPLTSIHPMLPKLLFAAVWVATTVALARLVAADPRSRRLVGAVIAYFVFTPYFWVEIALYGHFDILLAAAVLASVHLTLRHRERLAGAMLAVGTVLKIAPVVALPFLVAARPGRWKALATGFAGTTVAALAISSAIWGTSTFTALSLPAREESDLFSIFEFLKGDYSPLHLFTDHPDADAASLPVLLVVGALLVFGLVVRPAHVVLALVTAFISIFAFYKVGHPQFQMIVFVLAPYLFLTLSDEDRRSKLLLGALAVYVAWFSILDIVYPLGGQLRAPPWTELREILGLPTFVIAVVVVIVLLRFRESAIVVPPALVPARADPSANSRPFDLADASSESAALGARRSDPVRGDIGAIPRARPQSSSATGDASAGESWSYTE